MDITVEILRITRGGANKTQIVYGANLHFVLAGKYLDFLQKNDFIESNERPTYYQITNKGRDFLEKIEDLMKKFDG